MIFALETTVVPREFRIFGSPGCGKTTALGEKIANSVRKFGSDRVMVASFTKTAAIELGSRKLMLPKENVGTLHSFAYRAIGMPEIAETGKWLREWNETESVIFHLSGAGRNLDDPMGFNELPGKKMGDDLLHQYNVARSRRVEIPGHIKQFAEKWEKWKYENDVVDFTDMIIRALEIGRPPIQATVGYFDEVQDFSPLELALVRAWGETMQFIVLAGDDDQTIYGFRGAVPDAFLDPPLPNAQKIILPVTYRLPKVIKDFSERWIQQVKRREPKSFETLPESEDGKIQRVEANWGCADTLTGMLQVQLAEKKDQTIMVLASCGYMLHPLIKELRLRAVKFHNPYRPSHGSWNPLRGGHAKLKEFFRPDYRVWGDQAHSHTWKSVARWFPLLDSKKAGLTKGAKKLVTAKGKEPEIMGQALTFEDFDEVLGIPPPERGTITWLRENMLISQVAKMAYAFELFRRHGVVDFATDPRLIIGTIHSVKGGEADTVLLFPDLSFAGARELTTQDGLDSTRRLMYVGMTRARRKLVLCAAKGSALALSC